MAEQRKLRWYEIHPLTRDAMERWEHLPLSIQRSLARKLLALAMEYQESYRFDPFRPRDRTLPLFRPIFLMFRRRRWYDRDPIVRRAVIALAGLNRDDITDLSERVLQVKMFFDTHSTPIDQVTEEEAKKWINYVFDHTPSPFFLK